MSTSNSTAVLELESMFPTIDRSVISEVLRQCKNDGNNIIVSLYDPIVKLL